MADVLELSTAIQAEAEVAIPGMKILSPDRAIRAFDWFGRRIKEENYFAAAMLYVESYAGQMKFKACAERMELPQAKGDPELHDLPGPMARFAAELSEVSRDKGSDIQRRIANAWKDCMELFPPKDRAIRDVVAGYVAMTANDPHLKKAADSLLPPKSSRRALTPLTL